MNRLEILLIILGVLLLARLIQAELNHRRLIETLDLGFSSILDWLAAIKKRLDQ